jgi:hypothetical protein
MMTREGGVQLKEYLIKYTADRVRTVATTWLGSTFGCAECHDHKFDPILQKDFYNMGAFFADIKQYGVYSNYPSSLIPELKGFTNDHPFPPQKAAVSQYLLKKQEEIEAKLLQVYQNTDVDETLCKQWGKEITAYLNENPTGWSALKPQKVELTSNTQNNKEIKNNPWKHQLKSDQITFDQSMNTLKGTISFALNSKELKKIKWLKFELLPNQLPSNGLLRTKTVGKLKSKLDFQFTYTDHQQSTHPVKIKQAYSEENSKNYTLGTTTDVIEGKWFFDAALSKPVVAYLELENPIDVKRFHSLQLIIDEHTVNGIKLQVAPAVPHHYFKNKYQPNIQSWLNDEDIRMSWIRNESSDPQRMTQIIELEKEYFEQHQGKAMIIVTEQSATPLTVRLLPRGNWQDETGPLSNPLLPSFLVATPQDENQKLNRLDLAKWLVSKENSITSRVVMNRLWRQFFQTALSANPDDVGAQGESPSHPELLDWLAYEFRETWDFKKMIKLIVTSHTYQQQAGLRKELKDLGPNNRLLASQSPRRLDAEFVRDNALSIAGLLQTNHIGGPSSKPYQPSGYFVDLEFPQRDYIQSNTNNQWRRGLYTWWQRTFLHPMLANFDAPSREDCIALRSSSNTPQQALTLLNDPQFVEAAKAFAVRLLKHNSLTVDERLDKAFLIALNRVSTEEEKKILKQQLAKSIEYFSMNQEKIHDIMKVGLLHIPENERTVELAAWTSVSRVILNLHETITRY